MVEVTHGSAPAGAAGAPVAEARVWDPLVRVTHWSIALAVLLNGLITEGGSGLHVWIGYAMLALLALRLVWGFIGPEEARFASFPPSLSGARLHLRERLRGEPYRHRSHNPLGALMVYAFWGVLLLVGATGLWMETAPEEGAQVRLIQPYGGIEAHEERVAVARESDGEEDEGEEVVEEVHETLANLLLVLAGLHVAGVAWETRRSGPGLVKAMLPGMPNRRRAR